MLFHLLLALVFSTSPPIAHKEVSSSLSTVKDSHRSEEEAPVKAALFQRQLNTGIKFQALRCFFFFKVNTANIYFVFKSACVSLLPGAPLSSAGKKK